MPTVENNGSKRPELIIVNPRPFGYAAGYYYYCKYLRKWFDITFLTVDHDFRRVELTGVTFFYVPKSRGQWRFYLAMLRTVLRRKKALYFVTANKLFCWMGVIFWNRQAILDIRSGAICQNEKKRKFFNEMLRHSVKWFKHVTILSVALREALRLPPERCTLLPLGAEWQAEGRDFSTMRLMYVGVLSERNIHLTIHGLEIFVSQHPEYANVTYDIFGDGKSDAVAALKDAIAKAGLPGIRYHGRKSHEEMRDYWHYCNIGVSFVPILPCFEYQPPTKTFEYILAGMLCIGTETYENRRLINKDNGVLCQDTPEAFAESMIHLSQKMMNPDLRSAKIAETLKAFSWETIVEDILLPTFQQTASTKNKKQ